MTEYRTGSNWGVTIVRRGTGPDLQDCFRREDDELVAVVMNAAVVTGDLELAERVSRLLNRHDQATQLLEYALHLRQHGERAPGGNETWAEFDRRCEALLRGEPPPPTASSASTASAYCCDRGDHPGHIGEAP